jgi:HEAT repeat protein
VDPGGYALLLATIATLVALFAWEVVHAMARRARTRALRASFSDIEEPPRVSLVDLAGERHADALRRALAIGDGRAVRFALEALEARVHPPLLPETRRLLDHPDPAVRVRALDVLGAARDARVVVRAQRAALDEDSRVRAAAVRYLARMTAHGADEFLDDPAVQVRVAALAHLAGHGIDESAAVAERLAAILDGDGQAAGEPGVRAEVARALAALPPTLAHPQLSRLLGDPDPEVAQAAAASARVLGDLSAVRALVVGLGDRARRPAAEAALRTLGVTAVERCAALLGDASLPEAPRLRLAWLLAETGSQRAADELLRVLPRLPAALRTGACRALAQLARGGRLRLDPRMVTERALAEARAHALHRVALAREAAHAARGGDSPTARLLRRTLAEHAAAGRERTFALLGLIHPRGPLAAVERALAAPGGAAASGHLLDLLPSSLGPTLLALLAGDVHGRRRRETLLAALAADPDPWLRGLALYLAGEQRLLGLRSAISAATLDGTALVREAAQRAGELAAAGRAFDDRGARC